MNHTEAPAQPRDWKFIDDLKEPFRRKVLWTRENEKDNETNLKKNGYLLIKDFPDSDKILETAYDDLEKFLTDAGIYPNDRGVKIVTEQKETAAFEKYTVKITSDSCIISAGDTEGIRRGVYHLEDLLLSSDGPFLRKGKTEFEAWCKTRVSRCFFGPIKRPPLNRDELMDDVDYYPEEYLGRLAREGINGLWLTVTFKDLCRTSFVPEYGGDAERRLNKLHKTVVKCRKYGIKIYIFCIEPAAFAIDSPVLMRYPELKGIEYCGNALFCPFSDTAKKYLYESVNAIFKSIPLLGGMINISIGERLTTCLSAASKISSCAKCSGRELWEIHYETLAAMERGMHDANPAAELISWIYQPKLYDFMDAISKNMPPNVILQYNFETGGIKEQLNKKQHAGDYWLSYVGPGEIFKKLSKNAIKSGARVSAKLQVGCSHEIASIPYVPVPVLLFRKYEQMRKIGVTAAMQCWYFGNYPGLMNKSAGLLSFEPFPKSEDEFLFSLAASEGWGTFAPHIVDAWKLFAEAYENYPLNHIFGYYGPMHDGVVWPLYPVPAGVPLAPTWKIDYPTSGDRVYECFSQTHSYDEVLVLCREMAEKWACGLKLLKNIASHFCNDKNKIQEIGLAEAIGLQFESGFNILKFYHLRERALSGKFQTVQVFIEEMKHIIEREIEISSRMLQLCENDPRLGFHSEAEGYKYYPAKLQWRIELLKDALAHDFDKLIALAVKNVSLEMPAYDCAFSEPVTCETFDWRAGISGKFLKIRIDCHELSADKKTADDILGIHIEPFNDWPVISFFVWEYGQTWLVTGELNDPRIKVINSGVNGSRICEIIFPLDFCGKNERMMKDTVRFNICREYRNNSGSSSYLYWREMVPLKYRLCFGDINPKCMGLMKI